MKNYQEELYDRFIKTHTDYYMRFIEEREKIVTSDGEKVFSDHSGVLRNMIDEQAALWVIFNDFGDDQVPFNRELPKFPEL